MVDFSINLLSGNKILDKQYYNCYSQTLPLVKKYIDLYFSYSLYQLITEPTRATKCLKTVIDHILTNSPQKVI